MKKILFIFASFGLLFSGCVFPEQSKTNTMTQENPAGTQSKQKLDLSYQSLTKIPDSVFNQTDLEELDVSNNQLTGAIQAEIRHLQNLQILDASNNEMTGVPAEIGQLKNLQILDLSNNQLTGLPYELGDLNDLKTLNISGNNYSELDLKTIQEKLPGNVNIIK